jgi:hypothetical protein
MHGCFLIDRRMAYIGDLLGLRASSTGLSNDVESRTSQAIYICESVDYVS